MPVPEFFLYFVSCSSPCTPPYCCHIFTAFQRRQHHHAPAMYCSFQKVYAARHAKNTPAFTSSPPMYHVPCHDAATTPTMYLFAITSPCTQKAPSSIRCHSSTVRRIFHHGQCRRASFIHFDKSSFSAHSSIAREQISPAPAPGRPPPRCSTPLPSHGYWSVWHDLSSRACFGVPRPHLSGHDRAGKERARDQASRLRTKVIKAAEGRRRTQITATSCSAGHTNIVALQQRPVVL